MLGQVAVQLICLALAYLLGYRLLGDLLVFLMNRCLSRLERRRLRRCQGCCSSCGGTGASRDAETNGRCWDCYSTGHTHLVP